MNYYFWLGKEGANKQPVRLGYDTGTEKDVFSMSDGKAHHFGSKEYVLAKIKQIYGWPAA